MSPPRVPPLNLTRLAAACLIVIAPLAAGCAGVAEGITRALVDSGAEPGQLQCEITGPAFEGLEGIMLDQKAQGRKDRSAPSENVKVMLVHGMGSPQPGYSARLRENLSNEMGLPVRIRRPKEISLRSPAFEGRPLGILNVWRYTNEADSREMVFYELTWSEIIAEEKKALAYDTSGEFSFKRATLNQTVKEFFNTRLADPVIYAGKSQDIILESVSEAHCWMFYLSWAELPSGEARHCDWLAHGDADDLSEDRFVFVTHSMGSRVLIDALHSDVQYVDDFLETTPPGADAEKAGSILRAFQRKQFHVFMLANQLPLMQLGRDVPAVVGESATYCRPEGTKFDERILSQLSIAAFSDPNDVLSYAIPPTYADDYMDSRLCPSITNVILNVTPVFKVLKVGELANPFEAHMAYDADDRVLGLLVNGIGTERVSPAVASRCRWTRTVED